LADLCKFNLKDYTYDFNELRTDQDFVAETSEYYYYINFCGNAVSHKDCSASVCQFSKSTQKIIFNLAYWGTSPSDLNWSFIDSSNPNAGVSLKSANGAACYGSKDPRIVTMQFPCTQGANGRQIQVESDFKAACAGDGYVFKFPTCYSCPNGCSGAGLSQGTAFIILFTFISLVYITVGCWYNHRTYESPYGVESFPHLEYWKMVPGLVMDGIKFSSKHANKIYSRFNSKDRSNRADTGSGSAGAKKEAGESVERCGLLSENSDS